MIKTTLAVLALVGSSFLAGCAAEPIESEGRKSSESNLTREQKKKQLDRAADECPTTEDSVRRSYHIALQRDADDDGLKYWVDQIDSGKQTRMEVLRNIIRSSEFATVWGKYDDLNFVDIFYIYSLNREADKGGEGYCLGRLESGISRVDIALMLVNSEEFRDPANANHGVCYFE